MDEQQIIEDILDSVYGYNIILKESNEKDITLKKKERDEKYNEILSQINSICATIEKELKSIGIDDIGLKKHIRASVLTLIKKEVECGNKVIDSNGKINTGKIFDIVNQSKDEILDEIETENDFKDNILREDSEEKNSSNDNDIKMLNNFFEEMNSLGVDLTESDKDTVRNAVERANEAIKYINEKVESGMSIDEAWEQFTEGVSLEEIKELEMQLIMADIAINFSEKKNDNREDNEPEEKKVEGEVTANQDNEESKDSATFRVLAVNARKSLEKVNSVTRGPKINNRRSTEANITQVESVLGKILENKETCFYFQNNYPVDMFYDYGSVSFSMNGDKEETQHLLNVKEYFVQPAQDALRTEQAGSLVQDETTIDEEQSQMITQENVNTKKENAPTRITAPVDTSLVYINSGNEKRIPEETLDALLSGKGVDMAVAPFDINELSASASKPKMFETGLISGTEEIVVDETSGREDAPNGFDVEGIFGSVDVKSIVAMMGRAREIVDASDILQGCARGEITTEGRNNTQTSPGDNTNEVGGEEIE